jgi:hypothetical protein
LYIILNVILKLFQVLIGVISERQRQSMCINNGGLQNVLEKTKTNLIGHCLSGEIGQSLFQIRS